MRQIVLDTETTGLSFSAGHRIVEIGCVEIFNFIPTGKTFHAFLNPQRSMDPGASKVSGIVDDMLKDKPLFHQIADDFLDFIEDSSLVIHNAPFDMSFLNGELCLIKKSLLPFERAIDTIKIARRKFPGSPANLDALCRRFDIDLSERTTHGALIDAKLLAEVYLQLSGGRQPDLVLSSSTKERNVLHMSFEKEKTRKEPKQLILSKEEQEKHEEFLKTIKNPLWRTV